MTWPVISLDRQYASFHGRVPHWLAGTEARADEESVVTSVAIQFMPLSAII